MSDDLSESFTTNLYDFKCAMVKSRYIGDGHPTFNDGILIRISQSFFLTSKTLHRLFD